MGMSSSPVGSSSKCSVGVHQHQRPPDPGQQRKKRKQRTLKTLSCWGWNQRVVILVLKEEGGKKGEKQTRTHTRATTTTLPFLLSSLPFLLPPLSNFRILAQKPREFENKQNNKTSEKRFLEKSRNRKHTKKPKKTRKR